jgi:hypothetical protein
MTSFYGNVGVGGGSGGGGITPQEKAELKNHIIISKIEPDIQKTGDFWFVIGEFTDSEDDGG